MSSWHPHEASDREVTYRDYKKFQADSRNVPVEDGPGEKEK